MEQYRQGDVLVEADATLEAWDAAQHARITPIEREMERSSDEFHAFERVEDTEAWTGSYADQKVERLRPLAECSVPYSSGM